MRGPLSSGGRVASVSRALRCGTEAEKEAVCSLSRQRGMGAPALSRRRTETGFSASMGALGQVCVHSQPSRAKAAAPHLLFGRVISQENPQRTPHTLTWGQV